MYSPKIGNAMATSALDVPNLDELTQPSLSSPSSSSRSTNHLNNSSGARRKSSLLSNPASVIQCTPRTPSVASIKPNNSENHADAAKRRSSLNFPSHNINNTGNISNNGSNNGGNNAPSLHHASSLPIKLPLNSSNSQHSSNSNSPTRSNLNNIAGLKLPKLNLTGISNSSPSDSPHELSTPGNSQPSLNKLEIVSPTPQGEIIYPTVHSNNPSNINNNTSGNTSSTALSNRFKLKLSMGGEEEDESEPTIQIGTPQTFNNPNSATASNLPKLSLNLNVDASTPTRRFTHQRSNTELPKANSRPALALRPLLCPDPESPGRSLSAVNENMNSAAAKASKLAYYAQQCTQIEEFLYVAGKNIASNLSVLQEHGISQIVNCAGDVCDNCFEGKGINYLRFFLLDSASEDIMCVLYPAFEFIEEARMQGKKVLVHCFPEDHQILTNVGWKFVSDKAGFEREGVTIATYNSAQETIEYQRMGAFIENNSENGPFEMVDICEKSYQSAWSEKSDKYGRTAENEELDQGTNHISLSTTIDHELFVKSGGRIVKTSTKKGGQRIDFNKNSSFKKEKARSLLKKSKDVKSAFRLLCSAQGGLAIPVNNASKSNSVKKKINQVPGNNNHKNSYTCDWEYYSSDEFPFVSTFGLQSMPQLEAFITLYGYWLGGGSSLDTSNGHSIVVNQSHKQRLDELLSTLGLIKGIDWYSNITVYVV
jgi:hypothetical protein